MAWELNKLRGINMLFYDFEVFKHDWLVVVLDMADRKEHVIVNNPGELEKLYSKHKNDIWVGFNSRHYDQYIFKGILAGLNPKEINDFIIVQDRPGWRFSNLLSQFPLNNYDVMLGTDRGLKTFEGFMGNDIKESSVDFNINRRLTDDEIAETIKYCRHDVEQTVEIFIRRKEEFDTMMYFINHFRLPLSCISKTKSQLAAIILGGNGKGKTFNDEFEFPILGCLDLKKYSHIPKWYRDSKNWNYEKSQLVQVAGVWHVFAWGGIHGCKGTAVKTNRDGQLVIDKVRSKPVNEKGIFIMIDVTAYYPSQQQEFKFGYRVMDNPENFEFIHGSNIKFKKMGDKKARLPFKIMDNAISGQMKQSSSMLYDPMGNNSICVNGQLMLLDLIEHLEKGLPSLNLIQSNTDGILIKLNGYDEFDLVDDIVYEWEQRTGMEMEMDTFIGEIFQKDVNNYLLVDRENGAVKTKGAYVKKLNDLDYDLPIVNKALTEYMLHNIPPEKTILGCDDLKEFQQVKKISSKYSYIVHGTKILKERCIRCFASTNPEDGGLQKKHATTGTLAKLEGTPEQVFLWNGEINNIKCPAKLDKWWYINEAKERLKNFGVV
jgi:DNA polymerase